MKVCIVDGKGIDGKSAVPVKEDIIIRSIRSVKQFFRIATNNELYVCEEHISEHEKKRKSYERSLIFFGVLAAVVVLLLLGNLILSGIFDIVAFISAFIVGAFVLLFALVFKYAPAIEKKPEKVIGKPSVPDELEGVDEEEEAKKAGEGLAKSKRKKR